MVIMCLSTTSASELSSIPVIVHVFRPHSIIQWLTICFLCFCWIVWISGPRNFGAYNDLISKDMGNIERFIYRLKWQGLKIFQNTEEKLTCCLLSTPVQWDQGSWELEGECRKAKIGHPCFHCEKLGPCERIHWDYSRTMEDFRILWRRISRQMTKGTTAKARAERRESH